MVDELNIFGKGKPELEYEEVDSMEILKASKPANVFEQVDEILITGDSKDPLSAEIVDELSIKSNDRSPLFIEPVDELTVPSQLDLKLAKSTWDSLDVQGSGFELLGNPTVSRLENQDVGKFETQGENKPRDWNCDLEIDYGDELIIDGLEKPVLEIEFLDDFMIQTSKDDISVIAAEKVNETSRISKGDKISYRGKKQKLEGKSVSKNEIAGKIVSKRDTSSEMVIKPRRRDEIESESISENVSHISKKVVVDIKKKGDKKSVKPRRRDQPDEISESSHLSKKVIK